MPALYSIVSRAPGITLTAAIYNADHQNHVDNGDATKLGGFSTSVPQMQNQVDPGAVGSESLSDSLSDELARLRFVIARLGGTTFWYSAAPVSLDLINWGVLS